MTYFAYGSNLNQPQMLRRCPDAKIIGAFTLKDWQLCFRQVADIVPADGNAVIGALYKISQADERALDRYEGFPNLYFKQYLPTSQGWIMFYTMTPKYNWFAFPADHYFRTIEQGYQDFGIDLKHLYQAVRWTGEQIGYEKPRSSQNHAKPQTHHKPNRNHRKGFRKHRPRMVASH